MLSQQDLFVQNTPEEMRHFETSQHIIVKDEFVVNGTLTKAILTDSHIFLSQVFFFFIQVDSSNLWYSL